MQRRSSLSQDLPEEGSSARCHVLRDLGTVVKLSEKEWLASCKGSSMLHTARVGNQPRDHWGEGCVKLNLLAGRYIGFCAAAPEASVADTYSLECASSCQTPGLSPPLPAPQRQSDLSIKC